jgi:L-threonylcarbamoyladenylate synthase
MNDDLKPALEALRNGGVILYPTDTIWGLGCDATNREAVKKIFSIKQRMDDKSMLILLDDEDLIPEYVAHVPEIAWNIIEVADKPITIIYPGAVNLAEGIAANDGSVGIRIVKDEFCSRLIHKFGKPIVSTSANISGQPWPSGFHKIDQHIVQAVDYVVKYRQDEELNGKPSGIIKLGVNGEVKVIRE